MKPEGVPRIFAVALLLGMLSMTSVGAFANPVTTPNDSAKNQPSGMGEPILINIYLNGSLISGIMSFNAKPGSQSIILKAEYPWAGNPSVLPSTKILLSFSTYPFPVKSEIPSWLHIYLSATSLTMKYGESSSINVTAIVDSTAPQTGTIGSFEAGVHYVDPVTGISDSEYTVIRLVAGTTLTTPYSPGNEIVGLDQKFQSDASGPYAQVPEQGHASHNDPTWAIGVGLCDSSAEAKCNNNQGISWSSVTAVSSGISYPSLPSIPTDGTHATFLTVNAIVAAHIFLQVVLLTPYGTSHGWEVYLEYGDCSSSPCNNQEMPVGSAGTSGSTTMEILYSSGWSGLEGANSWPFASWLSQCCPSSTALYGVAQEPFAFESFDTTKSDFNDMANLQSPSFEYYTTSWSNAPAGFLVNANWGPMQSGWSQVPIGGGASTPSFYLEAGHSQCSSVSSPNVQVGVTGYVCSGATQTNDTRLF